jgi:hypothetical protein
LAFLRILEWNFAEPLRVFADSPSEQELPAIQKPVRDHPTPCGLELALFRSARTAAPRIKMP